MHRQLLSLVLIAVTGSAAAGAILETSGAQRDAWDILDFTGDASINVVEDATTPPGYGPEVLAVSGDHVLALAKTPARRDGTYTILYRELDPEGKDADGILVFGAQYGDDISTAHNTKQRLPHAWLEQDNDSGLHIRSVGDNGDETIVTQAPGVGLVDDPWNITGWIWQQVQIDGDTLRAKYWPAHAPEPEAWNLETQWPELKVGRVGFRIGSGDIRVAHFAVRDTRAPILPPEAWLVPVNERVVSSAGIALNLFLREGLQEKCRATLTLSGPENLVRELDMMVSPPATPGPITLRLTDEPEEEVNQAPLPKLLPTGHFTISIHLPDRQTMAKTAVEILSTYELDARIAELAEKFKALEAGSWGREFVDTPWFADISGVMSDAPNLDKAHSDAALRLYALALQDRNSGNLEACRKNLDRAQHAAETFAYYTANRSYPGKETIPTKKVDFLPKLSGKLIQSSNPRLLSTYGYSGNPRSLSAGHTHTIRLLVRKTWQQTLERELGLRLILVHGVSGKIVAESTVRAEVPMEEWRGGDKTWEIDLTLPRPDSTEKPAEPVIQNGWHLLCLQWIDLQTGDVLLQDTLPRDSRRLHSRDYGIPGNVQPLRDLYVSTEPVFLRENDLVYLGNTRHHYTVAMDVSPQYTGKKHSWPRRRYLANVIKRFTVSKPETTAIVADDEYAIMPSAWRDGRCVIQTPRPYGNLWPEEPARVWDHNGNLKTQIKLRRLEPGMLSVFSDGELLATAELTSNEPTTLLVEPRIGYYDLVLERPIGGTYHTRMIATVIDTDGTDILVNGEPFLIKGLNVHGLDGQSPARTRAMMKIFRDLGFNMLRGDYPPYWQMDMAVEENLGWSVLAPFSIVSTEELATERYIGPAFTAAREQTRAFVERYRDSAGVFLWNSANEIQGDITDFLINVKPVYEHHDPMKRPVHYANLYGQDRFDGQDAVGVNYYFGPGETPESRHPMILKNIETAKALGKPLFYTEYNAYEGAIHATGVEAMEGLYEWGVEQGMAGGFFYFRFNSERHPGVIDQGYNTHVLLNDALRKAFNDAEVTLAGATEDTIDLHIRNRRRFTLRKVRLTLADNPDAVLTLEDFPPETERTITLNRANNLENGVYLEGVLRFETHHGFHEKVPFTVMQPGE